MNQKQILAHHGSPGTSSDFLHLKMLLPEMKFLFDDRNKAPKDNQTSDIQLGYSYGARFALEKGIKNNAKCIILICPYLFNSKTSFVLNSFVNTPFLSTKVIQTKKQKIVQDLLYKTSYPHNIPATYSADGSKYDENFILNAIKEKKLNNSEIWDLFKTAEKLKIEIEIIYGEKDLTSPFHQQIHPLSALSNVKLHKIENAGHAVLWTHTEKVAEHLRKISNFEEKIGYYPGKDQKNNVANFLKNHCQQFPDRKILTWVSPENVANWLQTKSETIDHQSITVKELDYMVGVLAAQFKKQGIGHQDRVILFLPMSVYMYASMFALQKIGAIPTFLDSWARHTQMGVCAKVSEPKAMISVHRAFDYLKEVKEIGDIKIKIVLGPTPQESVYTAHLEQLMSNTEYEPECAVQKEDTALITFTTGSSGTPKGADRGHRFLAAQHYALNRHLPYTENDKDLPVFPIFSLNNLAAGVETVIPAIDVGIPQEYDGQLLYVQLKTLNITCTTVSPSLFNSLSKYCLENKKNLDFMKRIVTGGAPISRDDVERMKQVAHNAEILILYGSTEVEPMAHIESSEMLAQTKDQDPEIVEIGVNVGHMDAGLQYRFIKINSEPVYVHQVEDWKKIICAKDEIGELIVQGEHVCEKYFNNEEAFFRAKIRDEEGKVWHRTGDLGKIDERNNLWIVGRVHNAILRDGKYYFPVRAEIILKRFSFANKVAFLGVPDSKMTNKTFAAIALNTDAANENESTKNNWKNDVQRILAKNDFIVDQIVFVKDISMDPRHHSKVEYDVLRKQIMEMI